MEVNIVESGGTESTFMVDRGLIESKLEEIIRLTWRILFLAMSIYASLVGSKFDRAEGGTEALEGVTDSENMLVEGDRIGERDEDSR